MNFSDKAIELLKKAGWKEGRSISIEELHLPYNDYPESAITFLKEYGNLEGECEKQDYSPLVNTFYIDPAMDASDLKGDNNYPYYQGILGRKLFPIGGYLPECYYICCDTDGRVYKIGEYCYYIGKNLIEGVENILLMNSLKSLQLDEKTGKWWNMKAEYTNLP